MKFVCEFLIGEQNLNWDERKYGIRKCIWKSSKGTDWMVHTNYFKESEKQNCEKRKNENLLMQKYWKHYKYIVSKYNSSERQEKFEIISVGALSSTIFVTHFHLVNGDTISLKRKKKLFFIILSHLKNNPFKF